MKCSLVFAVASAFLACIAQAADFKVSVYREYPASHCTAGYLAVNDNVIAYTLERPWADNKKNLSSIPSGTYPAIIRYDHSDQWRMELKDVPNRENIQIHIGNVPDESIGCILVGLQLNADLCSIKGGTSAAAYKALKKAFYGSEEPNATPNKNITVTIVDAGPDNGIKATPLKH